MNRTLKDYDRAIDEAKTVLDDMYAEIDGMVDAMHEIYDLANNADEDNWKDCVGHIKTIAGIYC